MHPAARAVVVVAGGGASSPFTSPDAACRRGLPGGSCGTALREGLLAAGVDVFTAPALAGPGVAAADTDAAGFADPPEVLPEELTVNSIGTIDAGGARLAAFLTFLAGRHGYGAFDLVGHSMGGLFARAAIRLLGDTASPLGIRSLTTLGTPWTGSFAADIAAGDADPSGLVHDRRFAAVVSGFLEEAATMPPDGAPRQVRRRFLAGEDGWNTAQAGVLDAVPVTIVGGTAFTADGPPEYWPNDGLVSLASALAEDVPATVVPRRVTHVVPDVHSIFFAAMFGLPRERAITWDPAVVAIVRDAVTAA